MADTLLREQNPPAGQRASPVPQVWDPTANGGQGAWVRVHGTNNAQHVTLTGSNVSDDQAVPTRLRGLSEPPVTGSVVVTATQVELKAGVSALAGRLVMIVYPPDTGTIYWGADGVTSTTGAPLGAGDPPIIFDFRPDVPISIFAVSDGQDRTVRVVEVK